MKRFVVVGLGNFGAATAIALHKQGHDVIALDVDGDLVDEIAPSVTKAVVGDASQARMLEAVGAKGADIAIVSTGDDITASILATMALRDAGITDIYVKVNSRDHERVMARMGVKEAIFPERESAMNLASRLSGEEVLRYFRLLEGLSVQEMLVPDPWLGKSLRDLMLRSRLNISVVGVHDMLSGNIVIPADPDAPLKESDTLLVAGGDDALEHVSSGEWWDDWKTSGD
jgi:trk/ktr system potassium uptake protein